MAKYPTDTTRVNLNVPTELLKRIDEYANSMNINRTSAICVLTNQSLDQQKALNELGNLVNVMKDKQAKTFNLI